MATDKTVLKDKKITIYKKVTTRDSAGFQTTGYMPITETGIFWAYFKQLSADLMYKQNSTFNGESCYFRVNWNQYLRTATPSDLSIGYRGIVYDVTRVDPYEDYKRDLVLYGKTSTRSSISPIIPYDPTKL